MIGFEFWTLVAVLSLWTLMADLGFCTLVAHVSFWTIVFGQKWPVLVLYSMADLGF